jgi:transposase InsO family protein
VKDFEFIHAEKAQYPVEVLCNTLEVSRAGYYAWAKRPPSDRAKRDAELGAKIADIHDKSRKRYGSPRVHSTLRADGERVSKKRVARLMREKNLCGKRRRRFRVTTNSNHAHPIASNVLARNFTTTAPDQAWVGDITYIWTREGWLYLAVLIDLFSRRVVGWSMSDTLATHLAMDALAMANTTRRPSAGLVHHSDQGCQYASAMYRRALDRLGAVASMSRRGNCWDNAVAESFFATLKVELVRDEHFATRDEARRAVFEYIEVFYNRQRLHSSLGYATPSEVEFEFEKLTKAA